MGINTSKPTSTFTVDGYIEATKGFLVDGRPVSAIAVSGIARPQATEGTSNNFFGTNAGNPGLTGIQNFFLAAGLDTSRRRGPRTLSSAIRPEF